MKRDILEAIDLIGAYGVSPRRWEYRASETREIFRLSRKDLEALAELMEDPDEEHRNSAYSHWCAGGYGKKVGSY